MLKWNSNRSSIPRPDVRDKDRLMCSGKNANFDKLGKQLIKKEWDLIETWLKNEEQNGRL